MIAQLEATTQAGPHLTGIYLFGSERWGFWEQLSMASPLNK